jgi:hypothetical protein
VTPPDAPHGIGAIQASVRIDEDRPRGPGLLHILPGGLLALKRDHYRVHTEAVQGGLCVPQLQHVSATGQSIQMPMQHQEQPPAPVVLKSVFVTVGVEQLERCGGTANDARHRTRVLTSLSPGDIDRAARVGVMTAGIAATGRPTPP